MSSSSTTGGGGAPGVGGGGVGGVRVLCGEPGVLSPVLSIGDGVVDRRRPQVLDVGAEVGLLDATPSSIVQGSAIEVTALDAWGDWPPNVPASIAAFEKKQGTTYAIPGASFVAETLAGKTTYALTYHAPNEQRFFDLSTEGTLDGATQSDGPGNSVYETVEGQVALAVRDRASDAAVFAAVQKQESDAYRMYISGTQPGGLENLFVGCATTTIAADFAALSPAFLLATALGAPPKSDENDSCTVTFPGLGSANTIYLGVIPSMNPGSGFDAPTTTATFAETVLITRLRMASRSDGAWVTWTGAETPTEPAFLRVARVDTSGAVVVAPVTLALEGDLDPTSLDAAPVGDDLAIASSESGVITLRRIADDGVVTASHVVASDATRDAPLSLDAHDDAALVAWSEGNGDAPHVVRLARVCW
jgi:hypothetical protein